MPRRISQNVSLTPELGRFIQAQVASGRYQTTSEVIRAALRLLEEHTEDRGGLKAPHEAGTGLEPHA